MCGLYGELRFDGSAPAQSVIERMKEKLQKRGPDSEGIYVNAPVALGDGEPGRLMSGVKSDMDDRFRPNSDSRRKQKRLPQESLLINI